MITEALWSFDKRGKCLKNNPSNCWVIAKTENFKGIPPDSKPKTCQIWIDENNTATFFQCSKCIKAPHHQWFSGNARESRWLNTWMKAKLHVIWKIMEHLKVTEDQGITPKIIPLFCMNKAYRCTSPITLLSLFQ